LAISHIRHATRGAVALANTQPFVRELFGQTHVFAHNGDLPGIEQASSLGYNRFRPIGTTDSEHAFCALLERLADLAENPTLEQRLKVIATFASELRKLGPANFLYADGEVLFAFGDRRIQSATGKVSAPGLHLYRCHCEDDRQSLQTQGVSMAPGFQEVALVTSIPLTQDDTRWRPLAEGELLAIANGHIISETL